MPREVFNNISILVNTTKMLEEILRLPYLSLFYLTSDTFFIYLYIYIFFKEEIYIPAA